MKTPRFALLTLIALLVGLLSSTPTGIAADVPYTNLPPSEDAVVTRVIDGDTIQVRLANRRIMTVRYIGVNAPESTTKRECYGKEATAFNKSLVMSYTVQLSNTVRLEKDVSEVDRFGRLLRYVYLTDGRMVNEVLVRQGYAQVSTFPPDVHYKERFLAAQEVAQASGAGLWTDCQPKPTITPRPTTTPKAKPTAASTYTPVPPAPEQGDAPCDCSGPDLDCKDFSRQADAQGCWDYCGGKAGGPNPFQLDGNDKDGLVCESLP